MFKLVKTEILPEILPYKEFSYLREYFDHIEKIAQNGPTGKVKLFYAIFLMKLLNICIIYSVPETEINQILLLNYFHLLHFPSDFIIIIVNILYQINYYYYLMNFRAHGNAFSSLPKMALCNRNRKSFLKTNSIGSKNIFKRVQKYSVRVLNLFQSFVFGAGKSFFFIVKLR